MSKRETTTARPSPLMVFLDAESKQALTAAARPLTLPLPGVPGRGVHPSTRWPGQTD